MPLATQKLTLSRLLCHAQLNPLELADADVLAAQCYLLFDELANGFAVVEHKGLLGQDLLSEVLLELPFDDLVAHCLGLAGQGIAGEKLLLDRKSVV